MPQDPSVLIIPGGAQFLTAPDGTLVPTQPNIFNGQPGVLKDVTGIPLTAAPNRSGVNAVIAAVFPTPPAVGPNQVLVTGLYNINADDAVAPNAVLILTNTQKTIFPPSQPNTGIYLIDSVIDASTVIATKAFVPPLPPPLDIGPTLTPPTTVIDIANGNINWAVVKQDQFAQGDPLTYLAQLAGAFGLVPVGGDGGGSTPSWFNIATPASGPAKFANYDPTVQPVVVNDESGLFGKVQRA